MSEMGRQFISRVFQPVANGAADDFDSQLSIRTGAAWQNAAQEGQLAVDVIETPEAILIVAPMAGTRPEDINLHLHKDLLTIRGERQSPATDAIHSFYQECFWGAFSRTIVLPVDVREESVEAVYKAGVLMVRLEKSVERQSIPLLVVDE